MRRILFAGFQHIADGLPSERLDYGWRIAGEDADDLVILSVRDKLQDLLGEDSPPLVGGEESPSVLGSFLLGLYVSSDGVLADVSDASEVGRWRP